MRIFLVLSVMILLAADAPDEATRRWWAHVKILAADNMEGRDTGSEGYRRAARYVVEQFEKAGLKPAGENGYYQSVPLRAVRLRKDQSSIALVDGDSQIPLRIYQDITITPRAGMPASIDAAMVFAGDDVTGVDLKGKVAVSIAGGRARNTEVLGNLVIDNPRAIEPARWPVAYATAMSIEGKERAAGAGVQMRFNSAEAEKLLAGSGHTFPELLELAVAKKPLPTFPLTRRIRAQLKVDVESLKSDNILAVLPGSWPSVADEYVAVSAHLDGYGFGEPVNGDGLYNGAFDDSAYVAELIELAANYKRKGLAPHRSLLFCVFTGEEKGLLGSDYFTSHFTIPKEKIVADINLDYLRPIFPLKILTTLGLEESTLGESVRKAAEPLGIVIRGDHEPERGLYRRSDQYNFIRNGIPGVAFIFGYNNGSAEEAVYREWYANRYHRPSDDLNQPIDFAAAAKFNAFFSSLVDGVANGEDRPHMNAAK
ncbi:MAG: M28 family peptidase [Bryobacteraceae bacterium]